MLKGRSHVSSHHSACTALGYILSRLELCISRFGLLICFVLVSCVVIFGDTRRFMNYLIVCNKKCTGTAHEKMYIIIITLHYELENKGHLLVRVSDETFEARDSWANFDRLRFMRSMGKINNYTIANRHVRFTADPN